MQKRVLIITYYWPPSGGSGVQRWLKFAKYLPEFGWEPVIFTPENPDFDIKDPSLEKEISPSLEVIKFPIWEPYSIFAKLRGRKKNHPSRVLEQKDKSLLEKVGIWARANLLVPDPRVFWVKPSVKFLTDLVENGQFQAVITTGPPHSMHLIGKALKEKTGIYWLADFRDPWSEWEFLDTLPMRDKIREKHQALEQEVLRKADRILTISPTFQLDFERLSRREVDLLTNGFDSNDLPADFEEKKKAKSGFHLVYTGVIDSIRNPIPLLKAFREEFIDSEQAVRISFVGKVSEVVQNFVTEDTWLSEHVFFPGYVAHEEVFQFYADASALLLILTDTKNAKGNIPGKVFEYLSTGVPVLAIGDPKGDTAKILRETGAGKVIPHFDQVKMQVALRKLCEGKIVSADSELIAKFSRKNLTQQLSQLLDEYFLS
ncbi:Glycosyltransferase involved in cell wall bisynthesis [Algoriphagus faecimaris]|uniref:Glycosyltransferase involved in cell wall bisynthesis n=1 Tax=Algoriphagus faecimaris TaxID=686796 RepID=A0A1G6RF48_9BACT|nr:glycosyltransferase family 4 protein [Algoriphagus faecimaris]SDD03178.1 Glycosyltransferase involved in cell wall bisynthesis [Algoriphagus faecimaris]